MGGTASDLNWYGVRDMPPVELAELVVTRDLVTSQFILESFCTEVLTQPAHAPDCSMDAPLCTTLATMVCTFGETFEKHRQSVVDGAVGGGIVCSMDDSALRILMSDLAITFKPQQEIVVKALHDLRQISALRSRSTASEKHSTEVAMAAIEESGSPFTFAVMKILRSNNAAYVTFTKEAGVFRGALKFAKELRRAISSTWSPPKNTTVNVALRGGGTQGFNNGPFLEEVGKSLNVIWLLSAGSLKDPFCLMEVCTAVRQGVPVIPIRLSGTGMPLELPIWVSKAQHQSKHANACLNPAERTNGCISSADQIDQDRLPASSKGRSKGEGKSAASRRREVDAFYTQLTRSLPKATQQELHRNRFSVRDVIAATRFCFDDAGGFSADAEGQVLNDKNRGGVGNTNPAGGDPTLDDTEANEELKARPAGERGASRSEMNPGVATKDENINALLAPPPLLFDPMVATGHQALFESLIGVSRETTEDGTTLVRSKGRAAWNWERLPQTAEQVGRMRGSEAVPWRKDEELLELIKQEQAETDELAALLVKRMTFNPLSGDHQWEGCKGLADLAGRDSEGLGAVRRQGGTKAVLAALSSCPKDADVQRWGCEALIHLFSDPMVATTCRGHGVEAVIRALALLQDIERALAVMGGARHMRGGHTGAAVGGRRRDRRRRLSAPVASEPHVRDAWRLAVRKVEVQRVKEQRRKSLEQQRAKDAALEREEAALVQRLTERRDSVQLEIENELLKDQDDDPTLLESSEARKKAVRVLNAEEQLAEEQRLLDEEDKAEHDAQMAEMEKLRIANEAKAWEMTAKDIAIYDAAFAKMDKNKDGFVFPAESMVMFKNARLSKKTRDKIWELCDPDHTGKLTRHQWRVAYHIARSMKTRGFALPDKLPACLHPPGDEHIISPDAASALSPSEVTGSKRAKPSEDMNDAVKQRGRKRAKPASTDDEGKHPAKALVAEKSKKDQAQHLVNGEEDKLGAGVDGEANRIEQKQLKKSTNPQVVDPSTAVQNEEEMERDKGYEMSDRDKTRYEKIFHRLVGGTSANLGGKQAAVILAKSGLGKKCLGRLWTMADADGDGELSRPEFVAAMHLASCVAEKKLPMPRTLPHHLVRTLEHAGDTRGPLASGGIGIATNTNSNVANLVPQKEVSGGASSGTGSKKPKHDSPTEKRKQVGDAHLKQQASVGEGVTGSAQSRKSSSRSSVEEDLRYQMTDKERAQYNKAFSKLMSGGSGHLGGEEAASVLAKSGLENSDLERLWVMADADEDGELSEQEFAIAFHLASCVAGKKKLPMPLTLPCCLARITNGSAEGEGSAAFDDINAAAKKCTAIASNLDGEQQVSGDSGKEEPREKRSLREGSKPTKSIKIQDNCEGPQENAETGGHASTPSGTSSREQVVDDEGLKYQMSESDRAHHDKAFNRLVPGGSGNLSGKEAATVLAKSGLGKKDLGRLWAMADADKDGELSRQEFAVAMHIASCVAGKKLPMPHTLPCCLADSATKSCEQATLDPKKQASGITPTGKGNAKREERPRKGLEPVVVQVGPKHTKARGSSAQEALESTCTETPGKKGNVVEGDLRYQMSEQEKAQHEKAFCSLGFGPSDHIGGKEAAAVLAKSGLDKGDLSRVWTMADADGDGRLSRHEFAVAVHLASCVAGKKKLPLPSALPECLSLAGRSATESDSAAGGPTSRDSARNDRSRVKAKGRRTKAKVAVSPAEPAVSGEKKSKKRNNRSAAGGSTAEATSRATASPAGGGGATEAAKAPPPVKETPGRDIEDNGGQNGAASSAVTASIVKKNISEEPGNPKQVDPIGKTKAVWDDGHVASEDGGTREKIKKRRDKKRANGVVRQEQVSDDSYTMTTAERGRYDVVFMQIDSDDNGKVSGQEAVELLTKSGLTREQLAAVWDLADADHDGELDPMEWANAMHLIRCVTRKNLPIPQYLPKSLGGPGAWGNATSAVDRSTSAPSDGAQASNKGSKARNARREIENARIAESEVQKQRAQRLREQTAAYRKGKVTAAAFYITLAETFGSQRHTMIPKVALTLPAGKAGALVAAAGLEQDVLQETAEVEAKLQQLRQKRSQQIQGVKSTTSGATTRDVQLVACRLANRLCFILNVEHSGASGSSSSAGVGEQSVGATTAPKSISAEIAERGGVNAVTLLFRMFEAADKELMTEALTLTVSLIRGCASVTKSPLGEDASSSTPSLTSPLHSSLESHSKVEEGTYEMGSSAPLLPLLKVLHTPTTCRRVAEVGKCFPRSRKIQRLCCLFVVELGITCGVPARRCLAECCEQLVSVAASDLDESGTHGDGEGSPAGYGGTAVGDGGDTSTSSERPTSGESLMEDGVREAACQALAVLAQEPGLARRLVKAGAGYAVTVAMSAGARKDEVQIPCLEIVERLAAVAASMPGAWSNEPSPGDFIAPTSKPIEGVCRGVVESIRMFVRDSTIHSAASRAVLALIVSTPKPERDTGATQYLSENTAAQCVGMVGGATALVHVLAASPTKHEVQLPAVLAIAELVERCGGKSEGGGGVGVGDEAGGSGAGGADGAGGAGGGGGGDGDDRDETLASTITRLDRRGKPEMLPPPPSATTGVEPRDNRMIARQQQPSPSVVSELMGAGGCELICKSAKTFPRDRDLRLGCLRVAAALCQGAGPVAGKKLVDSGICEQIMKTVDAFPQDNVVRKAGLAAIVGIAEHGGGVPNSVSSDEARRYDDSQSVVPDPSDARIELCSVESAAVAHRFGSLGAMAFVAAWLRTVTAPAWVSEGVGYGPGSNVSQKEKISVLLMACKAATLLCRKSTLNQDKLANMGGCAAFTRAVAISGRSTSGVDNDDAENPIPAVKGKTPELQTETRAEHGKDSIDCMQMETQVWAARGIAELAGGHAPHSRCIELVKAGALRALFAAMYKRPSDSQLQKAGCLALGSVALACRQPKYVASLGRKGGARAVILALSACAGDLEVARAGLLAVAKLAVSGENRRLLGEVGACRLISRVLEEFAVKSIIAEEGCRAVAAMAALSGFNRTALGHGGAAEAVADALRYHPSNPQLQRWGLTATAALVEDADPSGNTDKIADAKVLALVSRALNRFPHNPPVQAQGLRAFAKVATAGPKGVAAAWEASALIPTIRALGLYLNDGDVQHWGMATMRAMIGRGEECLAWAQAGAAEAVVRTLRAFGEDGSGRRVQHDEDGSGDSELRVCTPEESHAIQFQACACALLLAESSDGRRRLVQEGAGEALAGMMKRNPGDAATQRAALATLAAMSASGADNRRRLHRYKDGVPVAVVSALKNFPDDIRVRCEGSLTVQNLSFVAGGARAMTRAGVAPVVIQLVRNPLRIGAASGTVTTQSSTARKRNFGLTRGRESEGGREGGLAERERVDRDVLIYAITGLANMAMADERICDYLGNHGACEGVVSALRRRPRDLQLQAAGCKAIRAFALSGGRKNLSELDMIGCPAAVARAQGLFLRDREVQLACLGAVDALCRGECAGRISNSEALVRAGSLALLDNTLQQFGDDAEVASAGIRALVELFLSYTTGEMLPPSQHQYTGRRNAVTPTPACAAATPTNAEETGKIKQALFGRETSQPAKATLPRPSGGSLPTLALAGGVPTAMSAAQPRISSAIDKVLAVMEHNPCREVCLAAFDALPRLLLAFDNDESNKRRFAARLADGEEVGEFAGGAAGTLNIAGDSLQWATAYGVKRALKFNRCGDFELASRGGKILALLTLARGRELMDTVQVGQSPTYSPVRPMQ